MRRAVGILILALAAAVSLPAQEEEPGLWMPEGYRLLSVEERQALSPDELRAIQTENTRLLREAIRALGSEERAAVAQRMTQFSASHELRDYEKQYVTISQMMLLSAGMEEKILEGRAETQKRFDELLRRQESETSGFPSEREPVENEAAAIEEEVEAGSPDVQALYLRALRPLRARPWNHEIRLSFRQIVRGDANLRPKGPSLYDAAIAFIQAREKESSDQGAWDSLEAVLRLTIRNEVAEAKRLFAIAIAKNSNDVESRTFPLLLAEVEGDEKEIARLLPRSREAWPKQEDLDYALWVAVDALPAELQPKAREKYGAKYKSAHPSDWESRSEVLLASLQRGELVSVEAETATLLALPVATLPEPNRSRISALHLRAAAGLGRCDAVVAEIPRFEAAAREGLRGMGGGFEPPAPRTAADVRALRGEMAAQRVELRRLRAAIADGSIEREPGLADVPPGERKALASAWTDELEAELQKRDAVLAGDDTAAAAAWTRGELAAWYAERRIPEDSILDAADPAA
ncbi:MAG TPA: hypothetical protein VMN82_11060, partial [Thermoanaerobaculia bacterium]|nr:hypothetical protein [Thermoanaerobaculia bacterium]